MASGSHTVIRFAATAFPPNRVRQWVCAFTLVAFVACSSATGDATGPSESPPTVTLTASQTRVVTPGDIVLSASATGAKSGAGNSTGGGPSRRRTRAVGRRQAWSLGGVSKRVRITFAGTPPAITLSGSGFVTTAPAAPLKIGEVAKLMHLHAGGGLDRIRNRNCL